VGLPPSQPSSAPGSPDPTTSLAANATTPRLQTRALRLARELLETVVVAVLVFLVVQTVWRNFWVEGSSMEPGIHNGESMIVERLVYRNGFPVNLLRSTIGRAAAGKRLVDSVFHPPQRGEVIVLIPPGNPTKDYIKRVIGVPGDKIEIKQGKLYINDKPVTEPYIMPGGAQSFGPVRVGPDELFVLGDNRGASADSRVFGMLPMKNVIGKAWLSYWPPRSWGPINHFNLSALLQAGK
jgi:signal peptidase I